MTSLSLNVGNFVTLKLSPTNYPLWREQALALAESQELLGHLTNEDPSPPKYTTPDVNHTSNADTSAPRLTEAYIAWRKADRLLRGWIIGTLSEETLGLVVGLDTTYAVSQLQSLDQRRNWFSNHTNVTNSFTPQMAFYGQQQRYPQQSSSGYQGNKHKFTSNGRGFQAQQPKDQNRGYSNSTSSTQQRRPPPPGERRMTPAERDLYREEKCQYCGIVGHIAKICWWVPKKPTQHEDIPQALAALTLDNTITETEWTSDTRASNHMTGKPGPNFLSQLGFVSASLDDFSILNFDSDSNSFHGDYSPPSPPPPYPAPHPPSVSCEEDLKGIGSLDTSCRLNYSLNFIDDVYIEGRGNLYILPGVVLSCPVAGCSILVNISGEFRLGLNAEITAGTLFVAAWNASLFEGSAINVTGLAGSPPEQTSGTPSGVQGAGGGHGGRGASCVMDNTKLPEDVWGGDAYSWSSLGEPWSYGSKGGTTNREHDYGGKGGGRIGFDIKSVVEVHGSLSADGGDGGIKGGGGSGGSIFIKSYKMTGSGKVSASGGNGFAGGGGGRVSVNVFSRHDEPKFLVHGGRSFGCVGNSGAAGTFYDAVPRRLVVSNHNMSTDTDTLLLDFPNQPLWTNVYIENHAKATVPLLWSRVQVQGQLSLSYGAVLSFGLAHYALSEFELMAEELLMSDSVIKVYGALRMAVKIHLMWNSKMLIDGDGDAIVTTSFLEASNLVVLREASVIHSNANLGVHGQGSLNLSGPGDLIEGQRLVLSLFYSISVGPGSVLRGPLENASNNYMTPRLHCELQDCPRELLHPPEDCNVNSSLSFTLQICRVEDIIVEGFIEGAVVHFHWVRTVVVQSSGAISASGLGCIGGVGSGKFLSSGLGGGGGHGGRGGDGYYNGSFIEGGVAYGNADLPCELGSGSGNDSLAGATAGGGIIVMGSLEHTLSSLSVDGSLRANGEGFGEKIRKQDGGVILDIGPGGGSGGTILLFVHTLVLGNSSIISTIGGHGGPNGGGGGGGRVHFHWSDIPIGDEYLPIANVKGTIHVGGGMGRGQGSAGGNGTVTGKSCPKGLYGIFCQECPVGTFKNISGSDRALCHNCPSHELPHRAIYVPVRGGVADTPCPYKCISERYHMPHCYTALEELIYTFGGPWLFGFIFLGLLILLALVLSVARMKFVSVDESPGLVPTRRGLQIDRSFPFLESLNEVLETNRTEESQSHVHRIYFMGPEHF
ncbi:hypothetical protein F0562_009628 [Nyssa sinensis]|uniref:DUF8003 domain-containing protein n=1 Tax=Nyssa sinensis TaxID=561372 RepID=A0A5J4ZWP8_9ASTE|nr:hypothetical protein F0562_009628 [Nyssa sinensis]